MNYEIRWDNEEKTVVLQVYRLGATSEDMFAMADESARMLAGVEHTVHLIIDQTDTPMFTITSAEMRHLESHVPPNQGAVIIVGAKQYTRTMQRIGEQFAPKAFSNNFFVDTLDEARDLLQKHFDIQYP